MAAERMAARYRLQAIAQAYDAASKGRRANDWGSRRTSANAEIAAANQTLQARSRNAIRNDPLLKSAKRVVRTWAVGTGIELQWDSPRWQALWDDWKGRSDASGQGDFYGTQSLAAGAIFESGSVLLRRRPRLPIDGLTVPVQVQVLEPDHLDRTRLNPQTGARVVEGVEFDALDRRVGYWLLTNHPGDSTVLGSASLRRESVFVGAENVSHAFVVDRPGQVTGVPWSDASLLRAFELGEMTAAELVAARVRACNVGVVTQIGGTMGSPLGPVPTNAPTGTGPGETGGDPRPEYFEPAQFAYLEPGQDVKFNDPKLSTAFESFVKTHQRDVSVGTGVPYSKTTGDLSDANYSSLKAGANDFELFMDEFRWLVLVPLVCEPQRKWFVDAAVMAGVAPTRKVPEFEWNGPPYPEHDPLKEANARLLDVRMGVRLMGDVIRSRGGDPDRYLERLERWNQQLDDREIVLDSDPRSVNRTGAAQSTGAQTAASDATETDEEETGDGDE